jgi:hypothetical protein
VDADRDFYAQPAGDHHLPGLAKADSG